MRIVRLEIENYRNLDGVKIKFHPTINFIIGESNLGKSNLLDLLNILFTRKDFSESDFFNPSKPINISFSLGLSALEQGLFDDLFDPNDREIINIIATQECPDERVSFIHKDSQTIISNSKLRCVNYIKYDSLRTPSSELNFSNNRGVGKFLNHIIVKYLQNENLQDSDFIITTKFDGILKEINQTLHKIKSFKDFSLQAIRELNKENILSKLIILADNENRTTEKLGYGVQFSLIITLSILERLLNIKDLDQYIVEDSSTSDKCIPIVIGLDEPEIHLHPYAQRNLIKYLVKVVDNKDSDFIDLLSDIFQINKLLGQILIVSHSPNILLNDYRQFLRFYRNDKNHVVVQSGVNVILDEAQQKQLLKNLPYVKEAFFSKVVILVEGDTELGAIPNFSERMNVELDEFGISIIEAGGADSIPSLMKLLDEFGIQNIALMDSDKKQSYINVANLSFTQGQDFEEDIYENFDLIDYVKYLEAEFINENKANFLIGKAKKEGIPLNHQNISNQLELFSKDEVQKLKESSKEDILKSMRKSKSILDGADLGKHVTNIPQVYKDLIDKAVELSKIC